MIHIISFALTVNRVAIVKPDVARMVGDRLIQLAQMGQIKSKVEEETIIQLLEQVQQQSQKTTIKVRLIFPSVVWIEFEF